MASPSLVRQTPPPDALPSVAVVGVGHWGPTLVRALGEHPGVGEIVVWDREPDRCRALRERFAAVRVVGAYEEVLRDTRIAAVVVATPAPTHAALALRALRAGKHALVEKPLTTSVEDAQTLIDAAAHERRVLMVGHTPRYAPAADVVDRALKAGRIGVPQRWQMHRLNREPSLAGRDVLWDLGVHDLALLVGWTGNATPRVRVLEAAQVARWRTSARLTFTVEMGRHIVELVLGHADERVRQIRIQGTAGRLDWHTSPRGRSRFVG